MGGTGVTLVLRQKRPGDRKKAGIGEKALEIWLCKNSQFNTKFFQKLCSFFLKRLWSSRELCELTT